MKLPKPKHCGQNWLDMKPTESGRLCGQCEKNIVDFTKMKWPEIKRIQQENNNSVCGMYSNKQLNYWGAEVPAKNANTVIATTALLLGLSTSLNAQVADSNDAKPKRTLMHGIVTGKDKEGKIDTLLGTNIMLKHTKIGTVADIHGYYKLDLTNYIDTIPEPTIVFALIGFDHLEIRLDKSKGDLNYDVQLTENNAETTYFYIPEPTLKQRVKWKVKSWFGLNR